MVVVTTADTQTASRETRGDFVLTFHETRVFPPRFRSTSNDPARAG